MEVRNLQGKTVQMTCTNRQIVVENLILCNCTADTCSECPFFLKDKVD